MTPLAAPAAASAHGVVALVLIFVVRPLSVFATLWFSRLQAEIDLVS
jgi:NhaP-type Na+/H+ or K+/H+ antiporter